MANAPQYGAYGGGRVKAFASSLSQKIDLTTVWLSHQIEEIQRVKALWDAKEAISNPVVGGV